MINVRTHLARLRKNEPEAFTLNCYLLKRASLKDEVTFSFGKDYRIGEKCEKGEIEETMNNIELSMG